MKDDRAALPAYPAVATTARLRRVRSRWESASPTPKTHRASPRGRIPAVAVGTRVTPRPPHRSELALLTHSALALGV